MNTMTEQPLALAAPVEQQQPAALPAARTSALNLAMDTGSMQALMDLANVMASSRITIPKHLQGSPGDCLAIAMQAAQWGMNAFVVAQKTHVVNGSLGYEAQLVNAVVQASGLIEPEGFSYEYRGAGNAIECRVGAKKRGQQQVTWGEWLRLDSVTTKNSPLWKTNPKQQLGYLQVKNWARAYTPGAILGIYTPDELETFTPPRNMGSAQQLPPQGGAAPEMPAGLVEAAENAAAEGVAAYQEFWKTTGATNRKHLAEHHPRLKQAAIDADAARTVEMPAEPAGPTAAEWLERIARCNDAQALLIIADEVATMPADATRECLEAAIAARGEELEG